MTLDSGVYRGWKISIGLINQTSGQAFVELEIVDPNVERRVAFKKVAEDKVIRQIFNFPEEDGNAFGYHRLDECDGFQWVFMFEVLPAHATRFSYLAYIFKAIDSLVTYIEECVETLKNREAAIPPLTAPAKTVVFPRGTTVAPVLMHLEKGGELVIQNVDGSNQSIAFKCHDEVFLPGDDSAIPIDKSDAWYDVLEDIYADEFSEDVTNETLNNFCKTKLRKIKMCDPAEH